jgi:peptide-methionine (S)-S-oxide reductase
VTSMLRLFLVQLFLILALAVSGPARTQALVPPPAQGFKTAAFAGGCFWCMVHPFDSLTGVTSVLAGYTGGTVQRPTYEEVSAGGTGHRESVLVTYDPGKISYRRLLDVFWHNIDPLDASGQFCDHGMQYSTAIFVADEEQRKVAEQSKQAVEEKLGRKVVTAILSVGPFWRAEDYHQDYYKKNPLRYRFYRYTCGRDARLDALWGGEARSGAPPENH